MRKYFLLITIVLLIPACVPSQAAIQVAATETQVTIPTITPIATLLPTATINPTATVNSCTDRGWADISADVTEFQFQTLNFINGVIVSEYLKTLRSIREKIVNVTIDACTEHARELVLSSMDNRISAQEMMFTGKFSDPNALTNALMQESLLIEAANAELASLGLQVTLPMPGSSGFTAPSIPSSP
jgi:hypothetical protein